MADPGSTKWIDDFINTLQVKKSTQNTALQVYQQAMANAPGIATPQSQTLSSAPLAMADQVDPANYSEDPGFWSRFIDIVERPLYATANLADSMVNNIRSINDENYDGEIVDPFTAIGRGLSGKDKTSFAQVADDALPKNNVDQGTRKALVGALGLAGDIALDPLNIVAPVALTKGFKAVKGLSKTEKANIRLESVRNAVEDAKGLPSSPMLTKTDEKLSASAAAPTVGKTPSFVDDIVKEYTPADWPEPTFAPNQWPESTIGDSLPAVRLGSSGKPYKYTFKAGSGGTVPTSQKVYEGMLRDQIDDALSKVKVRRYGPVGMPESPYEGMRTAARSIKTPSLQKAFVRKYKPLLSAEDFEYIQKARYPEQWQKRVDEVVNKLEGGQVGNIREFVSRAKDGSIPASEVQPVLDAAGVKGLDSLIPTYERLGSKKFALPEDAWGGTRAGVTVKTINEEAKVAEASSVLDADQVARIEAAGKSADELLESIRATKPPEVAGEILSRVDPGDLRIKGTTPANVITQGSRAGKVNGNILKEARERKLTGAEKDNWVTENLIPTLELAEKDELAAGTVHKITSAKTGAPQWTMRLSQVMRIIGNDATRDAVVRFDRSMSPSALGAMAAKTLDIFSAAGDISKSQAVQLIKDAGRAQRDPLGIRPGRSATRIEENFEKTAGLLWDKRQELAQTFRQNVDNIALGKHLTAKRWVEQREIELINAMDVANGGSTSAAINALSDVSKGISRDLKDEGTRVIAGEQLADKVSDVATGADTRYAKTAKANERDFTEDPPKQAEQKAKERRVQNMKDDIPEANDLLDSKAPESVTTIAERIPDQITFNAARKINPIWSILHPAYYGAGKIGAFFKARAAGAFAFASGYNKDLRAAMKEFSPEVVNQAWNSMRAKQIPTNFQVKAAYDAMRPYADQVFDVMGQNPLLAAMFRDGHALEDIQQVVKRQGIKFDMTPEEAMKFMSRGRKAEKEPIKKTAKKPEITAAEQRKLAAEAWRNWDVEDPIDLLERMHSAVIHISYRSSVAEHAMALWGMKTLPKGGTVNGVKFVKLPEVADEADTVIWKYLDKNMYYPEDAVEQFRTLEGILKQSDSWMGQTGGMASLVNNVVDPTLAVWKPLATILRPGHLVRNFVSDILLNVAAGVFRMKNYRIAMGALHSLGKLPEGVAKNYLEMMKTDPLSGAVQPGANMTMHLKGSEIKFNEAQLGQMAMQDGILPTYVQEADILTEAAKTKKGLNKVSDKLLATKYMQTMGRANELSSWYARLAQYNKLLTDTKFTSKFHTAGEARTAAAEEVKRFHPDTTGLSPEGKKYARRIMPFYSWTRQVIPTLAEVMLTHPQRITGVNKAIYNVGIAAGNTPDSISNPWPDDLMVPDFIRDQMGYIGGGMAFNTGSPTESMADLFNGNVPRNFLSMLNPLIKIPIETVTGTDIGTGVPIRDKSEYIDKQLPGLSNFASITGYSPTGTLGNWLQGSFKPDATRAREQGRKASLNNTSFWNFIAGMSFQDFDNPTYQRIAAKDLQTGG